MRIGIAWRLGALLAGLSLLAAGLTGYYAYTTSRELVRSGAERELGAAVRVLGRSLRLMLSESQRDVVQLATLPAASRLLRQPDSEADKQALAEAFVAMMAAQGTYRQVRLIGADRYGLELVRVQREGAQVRRVPESQLQEKSHEPYVFEALRRKPEVYLSSIRLSRGPEAGAQPGRPSLQMAMPVKGGAEGAAGVVVVDIDFSQGFELLRADVPQRYAVYLANQWGDLLLHPDATQTFGFENGRRILIQDSFPEVAELLRASVRATDLVARLGGDEFVVVCEGLEEEAQAQRLAAELNQGLRQPLPLDGVPAVLGASIGVSLFPRHGDNAQALLNAADQAMYRAKASGRDTLSVAGDAA